jgi:hypothetical protein
MPIKHLVLLKLKAGVTESQINSLYDAIMSLGKLPMVQSVSAGENFSKRSAGFNFGFEMTLSDLSAYENDATHQHVRETLIKPLIEDILVVDFDFPRATAVHHIGREVATPELQRWDQSHANEDLSITDHGNSIQPKSDAPIWRMAVAARPIRGHAYAEFEIDLNPKPTTRCMQIGVVSRADLVGITQPGHNFIHCKSAGAVAWQCNGGFVSGNPNFPSNLHVTDTPWEHDHTVGVLVDVDKGIVQFFFDRKKMGPTLHLKDAGHELFFALAIDAPHTRVKAHWTASAPKVHIG